MKKGNDIDNLFKEGLENPDIPFNEADWQAMEERLDPKKKRRIVPIIWISAAAGIAAMLLITFLILKPEVEKNNAVVKTPLEKGKNNNAESENAVIEKPLNNFDKPAEQPGDINQAEKLASSNKAKVLNNNQTIASGLKPLQTDQQSKADYTILEAPIFAENALISTPAEANFAAFSPTKGLPNPFVNAKVKTIAKLSNTKPKLVLSILAAPDLTSVEYSGRSNLSGSFGAELTLFLTKKLSITTGANYAKKIYESDFSLYNPNSTYVFKTAPSNIRANCDVIDLPLNVNYKLLGNNRNSLTVTTGLSSYLMLKENYTYSYSGDAQGPKSYEVRNQNQHYLGIANVGVEFQHKINNKLSISARPFMKIPLTNIGYGNSKLSSTGVAVSVNMNLFKRNN